MIRRGFNKCIVVIASILVAIGLAFIIVGGCLGALEREDIKEAKR